MPIDASIRSLVASADVELVATGFQFTEGPVWHTDGYLLFSDIPANRIVKWTPPDQVETFRERSGTEDCKLRLCGSNGLTFDRQGRLLVCEHGNRRLTRTEHDGRVVVAADCYEGKRLNSPNDVVTRSDGSIYFTDPPFGTTDDERELPFEGVYRVDPSGTLHLLAQDLGRPNGLALSPDERTLYVADTLRRQYRAFDVRADGSLGDGSVLIDLNVPGEWWPDGMKVDTQGTIYGTGPGGICLIAPDGRRLGTIRTPKQPANCGFGGPENRTLFITARTSVYRVELTVTGVRAHPG